MVEALALHGWAQHQHGLSPVTAPVHSPALRTLGDLRLAGHLNAPEALVSTGDAYRPLALARERGALTLYGTCARRLRPGSRPSGGRWRRDAGPAVTMRRAPSTPGPSSVTTRRATLAARHSAGAPARTTVSSAAGASDGRYCGGPPSPTSSTTELTYNEVVVHFFVQRYCFTTEGKWNRKPPPTSSRGLPSNRSTCDSAARS